MRSPSPTESLSKVPSMEAFFMRSRTQLATTNSPQHRGLAARHMDQVAAVHLDAAHLLHDVRHVAQARHLLQQLGRDTRVEVHVELRRHQWLVASERLQRAANRIEQLLSEDLVS